MSDIGFGSRPGQANGSGDVLANLPEIWKKEILLTFHQEAKALNLFRKDGIKNGKSFIFHLMGQGDADFHVPGSDIFAAGSIHMSSIKHGTRKIHIDRPLISVETLDMQELSMHAIPEILRMSVTRELGLALAKKYDVYTLSKVIMAARESAILTGGFDGTVITNALAGSQAPALIDAIADGLKALAEKNVPMGDRYIIVRPEHFYLMLNDSTNNASRFNLDKDIGSEGSFAKGEIGRILGVPVLMSNNLPKSDLSTAITGDRNDYSADFTTTVAVVCHKSCVGQAMLKDVRFFSEDAFRTQSVNLAAAIDIGVGTLRPEAAVEIKTA